MKQIILRLTIAILAFDVGLASNLSYRTVVSRYEAYLLMKKEAKLRDELFRIRKMLGIYALEKEKDVATLNDLVNAGYMSEIPINPVTGERDWEEVRFEIAGLFNVSSIIDIHSKSKAVSSEGTPYNEW